MDADTEQTFEECKKLLTNAARLAHPDKNPALTAGASDTAIRAVLNKL